MPALRFNPRFFAFFRLCLWPLVLVQFTGWQSRAQVAEIGIGFEKVGFVDAVAANGRELGLFCFEDERIIFGVYELGPNAQIIDSKGKGLSAASLEIGMRLLIKGEYFKKRKKNLIAAIRVEDQYAKGQKIKSGRFDGFDGQFAFVDGVRLRLGEKEMIEGRNQYKSKRFRSFGELVLGDLVSCTFGFSGGGYAVATNVTVEPDLDTKQDRILAAKGEVLKFHELWRNPDERQEFLGQYIEGWGLITNSKVLQDYVSSIGQRLIPEHLNEKIRVSFIVVTDPSWNASMAPNGICLVHTGLIETMQNEAQLAVVLGHEIAHLYYEHTAKEFATNERKTSTVKFAGAVESVLNRVRNKNPLRRKGTVSDISVDTLAKYVKLGSILLDRFQESIYSKDDELQADRVGLYLAATAGYDTRQAPSIWRAKYADNFREEPKDKDFLLDVVEAAGKEKSGMERESVPTKEEAAIGFGIDAAKVALQEKWNEWWKKSGETHPDEKERFERLYFYIALNDYSDASKKYITNEQLWMQKRGEYAGDLLKEQWKIAFGTAKTPEQRLELLKLPLAKGWEPKVVYMQLRALTYTEMGMWKEALADYELLRKIEPDNAAFVSAWARCKIEQGKSAEVLAELAKWIAKQPDNDALLYRRAEAFFKLQRYTDAVKDLTKALEIDTDNTAYLFLRGMCFYRLKKWPAAADDFESILMIDPDNAEAANNLELIRQEQEKAKGEKSK